MITKSISSTIGLSAILLLASCALRPVTTEYDFVKKDIEEVELDKLGNGRVLVYNGAIPWLNTVYERSNVWINGTGLGQLQMREYVIIDLQEGDYQFKVQRNDGLFTIKSSHNVKIDRETKVIRIAPTFGSSLSQTNELPKKFDRFVYAVNEDSQ